MKKSYMFLFLLLASFGYAANNLDQYPAVRSAMNDDTVLLHTYWGALYDDYTLQDAEVHPINYIVAPVGEHDDCTVELVLTRTQGGNSLETDYLTITVQILDDGEGNLTVGDFTVDRETVF